MNCIELKVSNRFVKPCLIAILVISFVNITVYLLTTITNSHIVCFKVINVLDEKMFVFMKTLDKHNRKLVTVNVSSKKLTEIILSMIESVVKPIERSSALKIIHAKYI